MVCILNSCPLQSGSTVVLLVLRQDSECSTTRIVSQGLIVTTTVASREKCCDEATVEGYVLDYVVGFRARDLFQVAY